MIDRTDASIKKRYGRRPTDAEMESLMAAVDQIVVRLTEVERAHPHGLPRHVEHHNIQEHRIAFWEKVSDSFLVSLLRVISNAIFIIIFSGLGFAIAKWHDNFK